MFDKMRNTKKHEPSQKKKLKSNPILDQAEKKQWLVIKQTSKEPDHFIEKLSQDKGINTKIIARLELSLRCESLEWLRRFIDLKGIKLLAIILEQYHENIKCKRRGVDLHMECELLKCFKALLNNTAGASEVLNHPKYIQQLVISIKSASFHNRRLVFEVLIFMCYYSYPQGQALVLDALSHLPAINETSNRFSCWFSAWTDVVTQNTLDTQMAEYSLCNMLLVNAIINVTETPQERIQLRQQLNQAGLDLIMDEFQRDTQIHQQIEEYKSQATYDEELVYSQPHNGRIFKNLLDPYHLLEMVLESIEGSACYDYFLDILQSLLLQDQLEEQVKVNYYERINSCIHHATIESPVEALEYTRKELKEMEEKYDLLLKSTSASRSGSKEEINHLEEKVASIEDLLRIARSTTSTLQEKLGTIQLAYEENIDRLEQQLEMFCDIIEDEHPENDTIVLNKKEFAKVFERIDSKRQFKNLPTENKKIKDRRRSSTFITEEFKSKLAIQFSSSNISDFITTDRRANRHTILSFSNQKFDQPFQYFNISPENTQSKLSTSTKIKRRRSSLSKRTESQNNRNSKFVPETIPEEESIPSASSSTSSVTSSTGSSDWSQYTYSTQGTISNETEKNNSILSCTNLSPSRMYPSPSSVPLIPLTPPPLPQSSSAAVFISSNKTSSILLPPPPPPPPLPTLSISIPNKTTNASHPLPPPPPPAIMVSPTRKQLNRYPSVKTRVLQWQKLHKDSIEPTVWSQETQFEDLSGHQLEIKLDKSGVFKQMEETFGQVGATTTHKKKWQKKQLGEVHIIESQKASNLNISVLARLKHLSIDQIKSGVFDLDENLFDEVILWNLYHNLPEQNEIKALREYNQDEDKLSKPDAFYLELTDIPAFKERIESMLLKLTFSDRIEHISKSMRQIMEASNSLKQSGAIKEFLNLVLLVGNFLNGSNFQGGAFGIRISSINKLIETKSSTNDTTLLHFIMEMVERQFPNIFNSLIVDMKLCSDASRINLQDLVNDFNDLKQDLDKLSFTIDKMDDKFNEKMTRFKNEAMYKFDQVEVRYTAMDVAYKDVLVYFGEDPSQVKPDEFFSIFSKFITDWERAKKDILLRKEKVERLKKVHQYQVEKNLRSPNELTIMDNLLRGLKKEIK